MDYIRKAVVLAPDVWPWDYHKVTPDEKLGQLALDGLAAELVRQVDAIVTVEFMSNLRGSFVAHEGKQTRSISPDRTMNTIKAIVDSGVLTDES